MKLNFKFKNQLIAFAYVLLVAVLLAGCSFKDHEAKESANLKKYKGCILSGKQFDWGSEQNGAEIITFKRNDSIWSESYMRSVWETYKVGDTIE